MKTPPRLRTVLASVEKWTSDSLPSDSTSSTRTASVLSRAASASSAEEATVRYSGRIPTTSLRPSVADETRTTPPEVGRKREPLRSEREDEPIRGPETVASYRFIAGEPMNEATNRFAGCS